MESVMVTESLKTWRVLVSNLETFQDAQAASLSSDIQDLGIRGVEKISVARVYYLTGTLNAQALDRIGQTLLADPITQSFEVTEANQQETSASVIEVTFLPGVMDPWEASVRRGVADLGIEGLTAVRTAREYRLEGKLTEQERRAIQEKLLYNPVIETCTVVLEKEISKKVSVSREPITVALSQASDSELETISTQGQLSLSLEEMRAIQSHFKSLSREPFDVELEMLAQTWSEHCKHKTLRGSIDYTGPDGKVRQIKNLLKETVMRVTEELKPKWCWSVFKDNAGVIAFDEDHGVSFKVETHNHPSAIEPFGGASTGVGGVIRDTLGTGRGAKPIANTDIFCFAPPDMVQERLPQGALHPKRVMKGVVAGVRDYGNKMGIPTVNGAVLFDERFAGNPLVYCGNVGFLPKEMVTKKVTPGEQIVVAGGRTGRDGIHGATFSSVALTSESEEISSTAVQIGDPITEKKLTDALLEARDQKLFTAVTDCGAGGLSSAVGEMGEETGAKVNLELVPLKYAGLTYREIWISEAQERMVFSVPSKSLKALMKVFERHEVEATAIGEFTESRRLELFFEGNQVSDLSMEFLHEGLPKTVRKAQWSTPKLQEPTIKPETDWTETLKKLLARFDSCSKEPIIRRYDHEVQGGSVIKPLVGVGHDGPSDAAVVRPKLDSKRGVVISNGIGIPYGDLDPYWMAALSIEEALRQIVAVGGNLKRVGLLDNFCWGDTDKPEILGSLVRAAEACYDAAMVYQTPFISGKDSLHNEYRVKDQALSIPGTLLISAVAVMPDVTQSITMDLKQSGNLLYLVGETRAELGGSAFCALNGQLGSQVPQVDFKKSKKILEAVSKATEAGTVSACHDCSEGGLGLAAAEMAFAGGIGLQVDLKQVPVERALQEAEVLFSESASRFLVEVTPDQKQAFEKALKDVPFAAIGKTTDKAVFQVNGLKGQPVINASLEAFKAAWQKPLEPYF